MGRHSGFIALNVAVGGGAEEVMLPETSENLDQIAARLCTGKAKGKSSSIIVVAEGEEHGSAFTIAEKLKDKSGYDYRVVVLGHIQRGGSPTLVDRVLATELGVFAIEQLEAGASGVMVGKIAGRLCATPFRDTYEIKKPIDSYLMNLLPLVSG
jgi:6-phosphofructokinase 1